MCTHSLNAWEYVYDSRVAWGMLTKGTSTAARGLRSVCLVWLRCKRGEAGRDQTVACLMGSAGAPWES